MFSEFNVHCSLVIISSGSGYVVFKILNLGRTFCSGSKSFFQNIKFEIFSAGVQDIVFNILNLTWPYRRGSKS